MKNNLVSIGFQVAFVLLLAACSKGGSSSSDDTGGGTHIPSPNDTTAPSLDIYTPIANQVFTSGNSINVTGRLTDDLGLYRGTIKITNDANGDILKNQAYEIHGLRLYDFSLSYVTSVTTASDYTVTVSFEDHGYNSVTKSVKVKVNP
jgi:hypothetical protein